MHAASAQGSHRKLGRARVSAGNEGGGIVAFKGGRSGLNSGLDVREFLDLASELVTERTVEELAHVLSLQDAFEDACTLELGKDGLQPKLG